MENAILAHRLCNRIDYSISVGRPHARDLDRVRRAREEAIRRNNERVIDDDPHALGPTLIRLVVMAAAFFEEVPDEVLDPHDALKYLEAISGEIDRIKPRDRSRFALLMYTDRARQDADLQVASLPAGRIYRTSHRSASLRFPAR